jgi:hypothetical protein
MFRKRSLIRFGLVAAAAFALWVGWIFYMRVDARNSGELRLAAIAAQLDATDPRWRLDDLDVDRGSLPDDQNGAILVSRARSLVVTKLDTARGKTVTTKEPNPQAVRGDRLIFFELPPNQHLDEVGVAVVARELSGNNAAIALALQLREYPRGLFRVPIALDVESTLLPHVVETRGIFILLDLEGERAAIDGRIYAALQIVIPILNAARYLDGEPTIISALSRMSGDGTAVRRTERALALGRPKAGLDTVQRALLQEAESDLFWSSLRGERAAYSFLFDNLRAGRVPLGDFLTKHGHKLTSIDSDIAAWHVAARLPADQAVYLEYISRVFEIQALPEHSRRAAMQELPLPHEDDGAIVARLFLPACCKIYDASLRTTAQLRCAVVGLAVERFRMKKGRWPQSLDEIPKDILAAIPLDPFDGKPLKFVKRDDGVTIYSVGMDEVDNGGNVGSQKIAPGTDIGFRLYDPSKRGLPAVEVEELPTTGVWGPFLPMPRVVGGT